MQGTLRPSWAMKYRRTKPMWLRFTTSAGMPRSRNQLITSTVGRSIASHFRPHRRRPALAALPFAQLGAAAPIAVMAVPHGVLAIVVDCHRQAGIALVAAVVRALRAAQLVASGWLGALQDDPSQGQFLGQAYPNFFPPSPWAEQPPAGPHPPPRGPAGAIRPP